jgi:hypothetical protein
MKIPFARIGIAVFALAAVAAALAAGASAKEGFRATLTSPIPTDAKPGTTVAVAWTVTNKAGDAFNASSMFVRLRGPDRGDANEAFASPNAHTDGAYTATVTVPEGGIAGVQIGVAGTSTDNSGNAARSDYLFPIANPPALGSTGLDSGTETLTWVLPLLAGLAVVALVAFAFRRRTVAQPQTRTG